ncbi:MAG TPA: hypothetical protein VML01_13315 [Bryobacterales bacterium]|nr:hypothetical protein [Bryobacterales bacterium]
MRRHQPRKRFAVPRLWLLLAGLETGVIAGGVALLYWMLASSVRGDGPWAVLNLWGSVFFPGRPLSSSFSQASLSGAALHLLLSGLVGLLCSFLLVKYVARPGRSLFVGLLLGLAWYLASFRWLWPLFSVALVVYQPFPAMLVGYLLFGVSLGLYPEFVRRLGMTRAPERESPFL